MKKILSVLCVLALLLGMLCVGGWATVSAAALIEGDYKYEVAWYGGEVTVTGYVGTATEITIPSMLGGYPVTEIGWEAFGRSSTLESVVIPSSVQSINSNAFYACQSLVSVKIPDSVRTIGNGAFQDCVSLCDIRISNSGVIIESMAFYNTAYYNDEANWDKGMLYLDNHLIDANAAVDTNVIICEGTVTISEWAFYGCSGLSSVTIPNSVVRIGDHAFYDCAALDTIAISDDIKWIGEAAFEGTGYYKNSENWDNGALYIGKHLIKTDYTFDKACAIRSETVMIADCAFENQSSLTTVILPENVEVIGENAFYFCESLETITLPDRITEILSFTFGHCSSLTSVVLSGHITKIDDFAFTGCSSLTDVYYTGSEEEWQAMDIGVYNDPLLNATIHYNWDAKEPEAPTLGDLNGDAELDMRDAFALYSAASGGKTLTDEQFTAADMNGDGEIDMRDAFTLYTLVSGG